LDLQFQYPEYFWLFAAIPLFVVLFYLIIQWKRKTIKRIGDEKLVRQLIVNYSPFLFTVKFLVFVLAYSMGVLALANPRKPGDDDKIARRGIDVIIALDVSKSMLATDIQPNRLERAKHLVLNLMNRMPGDRFGFVVFAGRAYLQMPLTSDHAAAAMYVSATSPEIVPTQGTILSEALRTSAGAFNPQERRFKSIILISDGEDHDPNALQMATDLSQQGVMICTVGIGSTSGSRIPDPQTGDFKKDPEGNIVVTKLNEQLLLQIAQKTNGEYINFQGTDQVIDRLLKQLSQVEKKTFTDLSLMNYKTYYMWFIGAMLVLLLLEFFIPERKPGNSGNKNQTR
jgi:Ca-activated chloride channel homolog